MPEALAPPSPQPFQEAQSAPSPLPGAQWLVVFPKLLLGCSEWWPAGVTGGVVPVLVDLQRALQLQLLEVQRAPPMADSHRSRSLSSRSHSSHSSDDERECALGLSRPSVDAAATGSAAHASTSAASDKVASPFVALDTRPESVLQWREGSINKIIYQDFSDIAIQLVAFQDHLARLRLDEKLLTAFNEVLKTAQIGLDHCKVAEVSEFGWLTVGAMCSQLSTADPSMQKHFQDEESSMCKQAKLAGTYPTKQNQLVGTN